MTSAHRKPKRYPDEVRADKIPAEDLNEWGYPGEKWAFAGFTNGWSYYRPV